MDFSVRQSFSSLFLEGKECISSHFLSSSIYPSQLTARARQSVSQAGERRLLELVDGRGRRGAAAACPLMISENEGNPIPGSVMLMSVRRVHARAVGKCRAMSLMRRLRCDDAKGFNLTCCRRLRKGAVLEISLCSFLSECWNLNTRWRLL